MIRDWQLLGWMQEGLCQCCFTAILPRNCSRIRQGFGRGETLNKILWNFWNYLWCLAAAFKCAGPRSRVFCICHECLWSFALFALSGMEALCKTQGFLSCINWQLLERDWAMTSIASPVRLNCLPIILMPRPLGSNLHLVVIKKSRSAVTVLHKARLVVDFYTLVSYASCLYELRNQL